MIEYREFQPTAFDAKGLALDDQKYWLVHPCSRTRDSGILDESNFHAALTDLGGESETVEVHRFGHWANGWFEIIVIDPSDPAAVKKAEGHEAALDNYPLLDESDYSAREWNEVQDYWEHMSISERVDLCKESGVCCLAARHDWVPDDEHDPQSIIYETLVRCVN